MLSTVYTGKPCWWGGEEEVGGGVREVVHMIHVSLPRREGGGVGCCRLVARADGQKFPTVHPCNSVLVQSALHTLPSYL